MRGAVAVAMAALLLSACSPDPPQSLGAVPYVFNPVCDLGAITFDGVKYEVVGVNETGEHTPQPEPILNPIPVPGTLETFSDGTATWTGNGYEVHFDANADTGLYQVC